MATKRKTSTTSTTAATPAKPTPATSTITRETTVAPMLVKRGPTVQIDRDAIAKLAYDKFIARGGQHGRALEDWLAAEAELRG